MPMAEYSSGTRLAEGVCYIVVPESVILDFGECANVVTAFSYMWFKRGVDSTVCFSAGKMAEWSGRKPDRGPGRINDRFVKAVGKLVDCGYVSLDGELGRSSYVEACVVKDKVTEQCQQESKRFAVIYSDEVRKIFSYDGFKPNDSFFNCDVVLRVFAYLRMMIYRRRVESYTSDGIDEKVERNPESYNAYLKDVSDALGMQMRVLSDSIDALKNLGLIYSVSLPRFMSDGRWHTGQTLFCNFEKREGMLLYASGDGYYDREIENKKRQLAAAIRKK